MCRKPQEISLKMSEREEIEAMLHVKRDKLSLPESKQVQS
jgi:hypothetical protein